MNRAYYQAPLHQFLDESTEQILGKLAGQHSFYLDTLQKQAWIEQIELLKLVLVCIEGYLYFEFSIPRMGKRVDVVLISKGIVFILEFKVGATEYSSNALDQVMDYALDLKNFHSTSHSVPLVPILIATQAKAVSNLLFPYQDQVYQPLKVNRSTLLTCLNDCFQEIASVPFSPAEWESGEYKPTPTIIEAAQALYRGHNVTEISRSDAGAINLSQTSDAIENIITHAQQTHEKAICFVTGVPGAGKTLAGLNIANGRLQISEEEHAVFLSGNGPLVIVLREALLRSERDQNHLGNLKAKKGSQAKVKAFIQNIHLFRDEYVQNNLAPLEKVVIFDEAQRAWDREMTAKFMQTKRGYPNFGLSEPEFLIGVMDRHTDWAVIICLVGGGQEINKGEAGLLEWFQSLKTRFPHWHVYISENITDQEYLGEEKLPALFPAKQYTLDYRLHLAVSIRSYRSENVSALVKAILDHNISNAKKLYTKVSPNYPIFLTRDLQQVRIWLKHRARGTERYGLLASSGGMRLRPAGIFVKSKIDIAHWFLDDKQDIRSSYALEEVATEFDIQGLELDWTAVAWDADLRSNGIEWEFKDLKGSKWQTIKDENQKRYLKNSYRVLLTRARQGMVIFIPPGDEDDATRSPAFYDNTYQYLTNIGIKTLEDKQLV